MDKKVIIMGATSGLGLGLAERFIMAGWTVGAAGRNEKALETLRASAPEQVKTAVIDILSNDAPSKLYALIDECGGMDIYLHCSGIALLSDDLSIETEIKIAETNSVGFTRMVEAAFNRFESSRSDGRLVAISSIAGVRGLEALPAYSASKAYDTILLEALRQRADGLGLSLRVIDIKPGWTRTPLLDKNTRYLWEMDAEEVTDKIFRATLKARRSATIGLRWKFLTGIEKMVPAAIWHKIHIPIWKKLNK